MRHSLFFCSLILLHTGVASCGTNNGSKPDTDKPTVQFAYPDLTNQGRILTDLFVNSRVLHRGEVTWTADPVSDKEFLRSGNRILTKVDTLFHYKSNSNDKVIMIFASSNIYYEKEDCHACAPMLSYAVFKRSKGQWELEKFKKQFQRSGSYGDEPDMELVQYGRGHYSLNMSEGYFGQGYDVEAISYYDLETERYIFQTEGETVSNTGAVEVPGAYEYSLQARFIRSAKEYWDLEISRNGTKLVSEDQVREVHDTTLYIYRPSEGVYKSE